VAEKQGGTGGRVGDSKSTVLPLTLGLFAFTNKFCVIIRSQGVETPQYRRVDCNSRARPNLRDGDCPDGFAIRTLQLDVLRFTPPRELRDSWPQAQVNSTSIPREI